MVRVARLKNAIEEGDTEPDPSGLTPAAAAPAGVGARPRPGGPPLRAWSPTSCCRRSRRTGIRIAAPADLDAGPPGRAGGVLPRRGPAGADAAGHRRLPAVPDAVVAEPQPGAAARAGRGGAGRPHRRRAGAVGPAAPRARGGRRGRRPSCCSTTSFATGSTRCSPGRPSWKSAAFRLTRDSELELDDEGGQSYVEALEEELRRRRKSDVVRLEIDGSASDVLASLLVGLAGVDGRGPLPRARAPRSARALGLVDLPGFDGAARPAA